MKDLSWPKGTRNSGFNVFDGPVDGPGGLLSIHLQDTRSVRRYLSIAVGWESRPLVRVSQTW